MFKSLLTINSKWTQLVFFAGALTGTAIGSISGILVGFLMGNLLAPKSGEELRNEIAEKAEELSRSMKAKGQQFCEKTNQFLSEMPVKHEAQSHVSNSVNQ